MESTETKPPYGGYALAKIRRASGDETQRFEAVLVRDGHPIAHVSNGGEGGGQVVAAGAGRVDGDRRLQRVRGGVERRDRARRDRRR